LGGAGARNVGLRNAHGDYLAFLDDDDEWLPNKIEIQLGFLEQNQGIAAVSCWHLLRVGDQVQQIQKPANVTFQDLLWENFLGSFSFCLAGKRVFDKIGPLDETLPSAQDWDFWLRTARDFNVHIIEQCLVSYNRHDQTRISSSYAGKAKGTEIIYNRYKTLMTDKCVRNHKKYICYYKSLAEQTKLKRIQQLIAMLAFMNKWRDWWLFLNSLGNLILPARFAEWCRRLYRRSLMGREKRLLGIE
jgi:glycosyltransferase involved in cell wall biosynthesis